MTEPKNPWQRLGYTFDAKGKIVLPPGPPFDGQPVLIKLAEGMAEAWWAKEEPGRDSPLGPAEPDGFYWVVLDDTIKAELDDAKAWMPLPAWEDPNTCPFDKPDHGLKPEDACPVCGDKGELVDDLLPSRCVSP
jgi:hypothetical protein